MNLPVFLKKKHQPIQSLDSHKEIDKIKILEKKFGFFAEKLTETLKGMGAKTEKGSGLLKNAYICVYTYLEHTKSGAMVLIEIANDGWLELRLHHKDRSRFESTMFSTTPSVKEMIDFWADRELVDRAVREYIIFQPGQYQNLEEASFDKAKEIAITVCNILQLYEKLWDKSLEERRTVKNRIDSFLNSYIQNLT